MRTSSFFTSLIAVVVIQVTTSISYAVPSSPPLGGYTGGLFSVYFRNIVEFNGGT